MNIKNSLHSVELFIECNKISGIQANIQLKESFMLAYTKGDIITRYNLKMCVTYKNDRFIYGVNKEGVITIITYINLKKDKKYFKEVKKYKSKLHTQKKNRIYS